MPRKKHQNQVVEVDADQIHSGAGGPEYPATLPLNEGEDAGSIVSFIVVPKNVTGGDATSTINIFPLIMQNQEDDPSGADRSLIRCSTYQETGDGDTNIDAFTGAAPTGKAHIKVMHNRYDQEIHGDYMAFRVMNDGTAYTGGTIEIHLLVKS